MSELFNIYLDESCHLEHDRIPTMVLGSTLTDGQTAEVLPFGICYGIERNFLWCLKRRHGKTMVFNSISSSRLTALQKNTENGSYARSATNGQNKHPASPRRTAPVLLLHVADELNSYSAKSA
jgi:hypothetical protein